MSVRIYIDSFAFSSENYSQILKNSENHGSVSHIKVFGNLDTLESWRDIAKEEAVELVSVQEMDNFNTIAFELMLSVRKDFTLSIKDSYVIAGDEEVYGLLGKSIKSDTGTIISCHSAGDEDIKLLKRTFTDYFFITNKKRRFKTKVTKPKVEKEKEAPKSLMSKKKPKVKSNDVVTQQDTFQYIYNEEFTKQMFLDAKSKNAKELVDYISKRISFSSDFEGNILFTKLYDDIAMKFGKELPRKIGKVKANKETFKEFCLHYGIGFKGTGISEMCYIIEDKHITK